MKFVLACVGLVIECTDLVQLGLLILNILLIFLAEKRTPTVVKAWEFLTEQMESSEVFDHLEEVLNFYD